MHPLDTLLRKIASHPETTTLVIEDPRLKPALMRKIVSDLIEIIPVCYLDFDLQFSSMLQNVPDDFYAQLVSKGLLVIQPEDDLAALVNFLAVPGRIQNNGVIILDSVNSLQTLLSSNSSPKRLRTANYRSFLLISVIQMIGSFFSNSLIMANVAKSRPRIQQDRSTVWEKELVGGRMMKYKSDSIAIASEVKHPQKESSRTARLVVNRDSSSSGEEEEYIVDLCGSR
ncbi:MAG: hypothetical protein OK457_01340 [Thaumarchaeota archaeon]|nr:hypothetical protein [Nitrososphaerota archaeon]